MIILNTTKRLAIVIAAVIAAPVSLLLMSVLKLMALALYTPATAMERVQKWAMKRLTVLMQL